LIDPEWFEIVAPADQEYIQALCEDFKDRGRFDSVGLFKHLTSLAVGVLTTCEAGAKLGDYPALGELSRRFLEL